MAHLWSHLACIESQFESLENVRVSLSCTLTWVQTDSEQRDLKEYLNVISSWTTLDLCWEQVSDNMDLSILISDYPGPGLLMEFPERNVPSCHLDFQSFILLYDMICLTISDHI